jgi:Dual specificity phosphatase, catalytic domain
MMDDDRIPPRLLVGSFLESAHEVEMLRRREGVTAVLNLQTDEDIRGGRFFSEPLERIYAASGVTLTRISVRNFDESHLRQRLPKCVAALHGLLEEGHTVYLHCTAGANRSPTVAIAYLHWCLGWDLDSAVKYVEERRYCMPKADAIRQANWHPLHTVPEAGGSDGRETG